MSHHRTQSNFYLSTTHIHLQQLFSFFTFILFYVEIFRVAILDLCAEAVSAPERFERGLYGRYQFLQPHFNGHQLPAGEASRKGIFMCYCA